MVWYGAGAELLVYVDAQAAMFKLRAFGDELAKDLVRRTDARPHGDKFFHRVQALQTNGTLVPEIYRAFDRLRDQGNRAVHDHLGEVRAALELLRTCFELGVWFHRALTGDRSPIGFVPPTPPPQQVPQSVADALAAELERYKNELAQTKLLLDGNSMLVFNVRTDMAERQDLAKSRQDVARRLRPLLAAWEEEVNAEAKARKAVVPAEDPRVQAN